MDMCQECLYQYNDHPYSSHSKTVLIEYSNTGKIIWKGSSKSNPYTMRVRFHLAKGPNFLKWQIKHKKYTKYYEPDDVCIYMFSCRLQNNKIEANKIYNGKNKSVCAWVACDQVTIFNKKRKYDLGLLSELDEVKFNPRIKPNWTDGYGEDIDGECYSLIVSDGRSLFARKTKK